MNVSINFNANYLIYYFIVFLTLAYIYHITPKLILFINEYVFIILGLTIFHLILMYYEHYENFDSSPQPAEVKPVVHDNFFLNDLTNLEILNHVQNVITNLNRKDVLDGIMYAITREENVKKRFELVSIFELTVSNPELMSKMAVASPEKILELINVMKDVPDIKKTLLENKLEPPSSSMKYTQLPKEAYLPAVRKEDDDWDTTGYHLLDPSVWRPRIQEEINRFQEGECPVCPTLTQGYPINLKDFDKSRYVLPADNISIDYIKNLNSKQKF